MSILLTKISKNYGAQKALKEVSLTIKKGQITGLLGPNGAGKSTLMKIITGAILPTSGTAEVNGIDVV
ncbi:MAG: ATP-binding cassette domain-containing protein, partial [Bacteroidetes bacterium]|nr:ATP-binding cassette domain-containing protein [Bacteroidota bacterium]